MKWIDWLKSKGINPEDNIPEEKETKTEEKKDEVTEEKEKEKNDDSVYLQKIEELQKEILSLKEANRELAIKGDIQHAVKSIEEEISTLMDEF